MKTLIVAAFIAVAFGSMYLLCVAGAWAVATVLSLKINVWLWGLVVWIAVAIIKLIK